MVFEEEDEREREREREEIVPNLRSNAKVTDEAKTEVGWGRGGLIFKHVQGGRIILDAV